MSPRCPFDVGPEEIAGRWDTEAPFAALAALRSQAPLWWDEAAGTWLVTGHAEALAVLANADAFSANPAPNGPAGGPASPEASLFERALDSSLVAVPTARHRQIRQIAGRCVDQDRSKALRPRVEAVVDGLLAEAATLRSIEWMSAVARPLPSIVIGEVLGFHPHEMAAFTDSVHDAIRLIEPGLDGDGFTRAVAGVEAICVAVGDRMDHPRHYGLPATSLMAVLAEAEAGGAVTRDEALGAATVMVLGGVDTTALAAGIGLLTLIAPGGPGTPRPTDDIPAVVNEMLRVAPPSKGVSRWATVDIEMAGCKIAAGEQVTVTLGAANRDPSAFAEPDVFRPGHHHSRILTFGHGPHTCLGMAVARMELEVLLERLGRFDVRLAGEPVWDDRPGVMRGLTSLPVSLTTRRA